MFKHFEVLKMNQDLFSNIVSFCFIYSILFLFSFIFFMKMNRMNFFFKIWVFYSMKVFSMQEKVSSIKGSSFVLSALFFLLFFMNLFGLIPMSISLTTQLLLTLPLALMLWASIFSSTFLFFKKSFISSLIPKGVILLLSPFLSLIELISHLSRPMTLAIRLTANMTAGHVMLALIMTAMFSQLMMFKVVTLFCFILWMGYLLVEFAISFIQGGIFTILNSVYLSEHL